MPENKIRVFIMDDHDVVIDGLKKVFEDSSHVAFAGRANEGQGLLDQLRECHQEVDLILMDIRIHMEGAMNGFEATSKVKDLYPHIKVIMLTGAIGRLPMAEAVRHRAEGYFNKGRTTKQLLDAIGRVVKGEFVFLPDEYDGADPPPAPRQAPELSSLEHDVLCRTARGDTADEVSVALKMTRSNIDRIRRNLMSKFDVRNVAELVFVATQFGFCQENQDKII